MITVISVYRQAVFIAFLVKVGVIRANNTLNFSVDDVATGLQVKKRTLLLSHFGTFYIGTGIKMLKNVHVSNSLIRHNQQVEML